MKKYSKLILPSLYIGVIGVMVFTTTLIITGVKRYISDQTEYNYTLDKVFEGDITPVMKTENNTIVRPYISNNVKIGKYFYDFESEKEKQENALIKYKNTYLQNTGVDYISDDTFDIISILDGEVIGIEEEDIYGKIVTIKHNDNLTSKYSNLDNVLVSVGYKTTQGEIIAISSKSKIDSKINSLLHFEVLYKGNVIDPENLYTLKVSDLR